MTTDNQGLPQDQRDSEAREADAYLVWHEYRPEETWLIKADQAGSFQRTGLVRKPLYAGKVTEPTLIQYRMRAKFEPEGYGWHAWKDCSEETAREKERADDKDDWQYEVRRLYARPAPEALGAAKGELSDAEIDALIYKNTGLSRRQFPDQYGDVLNLAKDILAKAKGEQA